MRTRSTTDPSLWFERDGAHVCLLVKDSEKAIWDVWDEDVHYRRGRYPHPRDWHGTAVEYANHLGL